jgi:hypothetical protein
MENEYGEKVDGFSVTTVEFSTFSAVERLPDGH